MGPIHITRRQWIGGAAALGAGLALPAAALAQGTADWLAVRRLLARYVDTRKVANMVVALGFDQAPPTLIANGTDAFGQSRRSDGNSLYRIYSMTKLVTGMATMQAIDEGKLGLDQPLHEILPAYRSMQVQKVYDGGIGPGDLEPAREPITIRHLLTHTSGLGYPIVQTGPIAEAMRDRGVVPGMASRLQTTSAFRGTPVRGLANFADRLAEFPLVCQPGTRWSYSLSADLLGRVLEVVEDTPFDRLLRERFLDPLDMNDTGFHVTAAKADRLTTSYFMVGNFPLPIDTGRYSVFLDEPPLPFGGSGLVSSPRDFDRFLQMLLGYGAIDGTRVMSESAVRLGTSDLLPDAVRDALGPQWGFGALGRVGRGAMEGVYGWGGAAGTIAFVHFGAGLRAGLYTQYIPGDAFPLVEEFSSAVLTDLKSRVPA